VARFIATTQPASASGVARGLARPGVLAALSLLASTLAGCRASLPHGEGERPLPASSSAELCEYVSGLPYVTAEAAYRAAYALRHGEVFQGDFASLSDALAAERIVDPSWGYAADEFVHRSSVGYMICRACKIELGLNWWLTGMGRYAWRELQYRGVARTSAGELSYISGGEFLGILARAEEHMRGIHRPLSPAAELGSGQP
jgi:hypothetical protein